MSWGSIYPVGTRQLLELDHLAVIQRILSPEQCAKAGKHDASRRVKELHREGLFTMFSDQEQALVRSQAGPGAGAALTAIPTCNETSIPSHLFRVVLLRRLRQPLPISERSCRCGRLLDVCGHHRAACARVGMLGRRGFSLESAAARVCREAKGRVRTNVFIRGLGSGNSWSGRRTETRGGGGRPPSERRSAVGSGHHVGVRIARGRFPQKARKSERRGSHFRLLSGGKLPHTQSWRDPTAVPSLWCWLSRWADVGQMRQGAS